MAEYYASQSTDSGNNTGWQFRTSSSFYLAELSEDRGGNTGWIFTAIPPRQGGVPKNKRQLQKQQGYGTLRRYNGEDWVHAVLKLNGEEVNFRIYREEKWQLID